MSLLDSKTQALVNQGFSAYGKIMRKGDDIATIDEHGRVQWWKAGVNGSIEKPDSKSLSKAEDK